jgi:hypothetical protein
LSLYLKSLLEKYTVRKAKADLVLTQVHSCGGWSADAKEGRGVHVCGKEDWQREGGIGGGALVDRED